MRGDIRCDDGVKWYVTHANCAGIGHASVGPNGGRRYARFRCFIIAYESLETGYSMDVLLTPISRTSYEVRRGFDQATGHQATPN